MKVYLVSSGAYSDYSIEAVFSMEEKANGYAMLDNERQVEVYELDDWIPPEYCVVTIGSWRNGYISEYYKWMECDEHGVKEYKNPDTCYDIKVKVSKDKEYMLKSAYDKLAQYKATKAGIS